MAQVLPERRGRGRPMVDPKFDDWFGVEDAKERKKIQDRLAQRARRKRIGPAQCSKSSRAKSSPHTVKDTTLQPKQNSVEATPKSGASDLVVVVNQLPPRQTLSLPIPSTTNSQDDGSWAWAIFLRVVFNSGVTIDHKFIRSPPSWSIFAALSDHAIMQNTFRDPCDNDGLSPVEYRTLPAALRPTPLQLTTVHRRWIDRFPFPRMRDNLILLSAIIDLDEFVRDLFNTASLTLRRQGGRLGPTWDPTSWKLGPEFATKWGYLFM